MGLLIIFTFDAKFGSQLIISSINIGSLSLIDPLNEILDCTDETACNYNPEATLDDNSCVYIESQEINGSNIVQPLEVHTYNYSDTSMESYNWSVSNGEIITGNGSSEISVKWDIGQTGIVSLMASSNECSTAIIDYNVNIELPQNSDEFSFVFEIFCGFDLSFSHNN